MRRADSLVDGKPCLRIVYVKGSRLPWARIVDELRHMEEGELLGMMVLNISWLPYLAFPFALHARKHQVAGGVQKSEISKIQISSVDVIGGLE